MQSRVTVLMPVYNGERYLKEAIDSILSQTRKDFDFLIINDGSTDSSEEIIKSYHDPRITLVNHDKNRGLVEALNQGLDLACGDYVARMDCDDVSLPSRLEKQVCFMDKNKDVGVCGTWIKFIGTNRIKKYPVSHESIKFNYLYSCPIAHPTIMIRKSIFAANNIKYDDNYKHAEDYELWSRTMNTFCFANIPEVLLHYRKHDEQVTNIHSKEQTDKRIKIRAKYLSDQLGLSQNDKKDIARWLYLDEYLPSEDMLIGTDILLEKMTIANTDKKVFKETDFNKYLAERWWEVCTASCSIGLTAWKYYHEKKWRRRCTATVVNELKLIAKCMIKMK